MSLMARMMMVFLLAFYVYGVRMVKKRDGDPVGVLNMEGVALEATDIQDATVEPGDSAVNSTDTGVSEAFLDKTEAGRRRRRGCCGEHRRRGKENCKKDSVAKHRRRTTCVAVDDLREGLIGQHGCPTHAWKNLTLAECEEAAKPYYFEGTRGQAAFPPGCYRRGECFHGRPCAAAPRFGYNNFNGFPKFTNWKEM